MEYHEVIKHRIGYLKYKLIWSIGSMLIAAAVWVFSSLIIKSIGKIIYLALILDLFFFVFFLFMVIKISRMNERIEKLYKKYLDLISTRAYKDKIYN